MTFNILHLTLLLTAHSGSILVHLHYGGVHTASLRATAEDRMGRLLLYSCAVDHIHATRGDFLRPTQCSMCSVCSTVQCTTAQYVQHSAVRWSAVHTVQYAQYRQDKNYSFNYDLVCFCFFCLACKHLWFSSSLFNTYGSTGNERYSRTYCDLHFIHDIHGHFRARFWVP